jgi:peptidyl-prolyl cis-trans isomerase D
MTAASESTLKKQVVEGMIANQLAVQAAKAAGFEVTTDEANAAILNIPQFQQDGHFSSERYQQALSGAMFTPESFQKEVRQGMLLNQQRFAFMGSAFALPGEIKRFVQLYMQTRDYNYLEIPTALFTDHIKITDEALSDFYNKHQKEFTAPEKVSIDYIRLSMNQIRDNVKVNEADIKRYYEENQNSFFMPAKWQVAHILFTAKEADGEDGEQKIKQQVDEAYQTLQNDPALFSEWVKTRSADKLSSSTDGVLPWIVAGTSAFDKALSALNQPGQISQPVKTDNGYEIFKLIAYKPSTLKPLEQVKETIAEQLMNELAQTSYSQALEQLSDLSYQTPDSLSPAADALALKIEHTEPFSREGGDTEITKNKQLLNTAFSHDVLDLGNNSEPVQFDNNSVIVLRVNKHIPSTVKSLVEVKNTIYKQLTLIQAGKEAKQLGMDLLSAKTDKEKQEQIIQDKKLQWQEVEKATRDTDKANPLINDLAFSLARINTRKGRSLGNGAYVIVQLKKINDGDYASLDKEQQASLGQQIESSYGMMDYDLYINKLIANAKIVRH